MEIRQVLRGNNTSFAPARPAGNGEKKTAGSLRPAADRLELSRQWVQTQAGENLLGKKKSNGILDLLDEPSDEEEELDALSQQLKVQRKCVEIAARIMAGKRVPPQDERYLMENDPEGYKLAIALRNPPKKDEKECESVLDEEDKKSGEASGEETAVPVEAPSSGGTAAAPSGEET